MEHRQRPWGDRKDTAQGVRPTIDNFAKAKESTIWGPHAQEVSKYWKYRALTFQPWKISSIEVCGLQSVRFGYFGLSHLIPVFISMQSEHTLRLSESGVKAARCRA